jgi:GntR family transcriptional regulator/MocR family aminotransferase
VLLDPGDDVAIEEPQYNAITKVLQVHGANLVPVPVDGNGLRCALLPEKPPRLVCVTPSHQFPTGALLSLPRRLELLEYARRQRSWIFEDDYDGEFRYNTRPHAALRALDASRVIYVGTFSKAMFPSLRLGYVVVPTGLRDDFLVAKRLADFASAGIEQTALARFMADGGFDRHLRRTAKTLKQRRAALFGGLARHAGERVEVADSRAGMHLVVWLRGYDAARGDAFIEHARSRGLGLHSIRPYYLEPPDRAGLLLGYGALTEGAIQEAMRLFGQCLDEVEGAPRR